MTSRQLVCMAIGSVAATLFLWSLRSNRHPTQDMAPGTSPIETAPANQVEVAAEQKSESQADAPG